MQNNVETHIGDNRTMVKDQVAKLRVMCHQTPMEFPWSPLSWLVIWRTRTTGRPWSLNCINEFP